MTTMTQIISEERHSGTSLRKVSSVLEPARTPGQTDLICFAEAPPKMTSRSNTIRRKHAQELIEADEDIRRHIARELHDDIGQRLSLLSIRLGLLQQSHAVDDPDDSFAESLRDLNILISDVHNLSHSLHSSRIEHLGLDAALQELFMRLRESHGTHIDFLARNIPHRLPSNITLCFFRIAQESFNNAIKHGGALRIQVELAVRDGALTMRVRDFGIGFDKSLAQEGLGLTTMQERIAAIGGTLTVESGPGLGTVISAAVNFFLRNDLPD